MSYLDPLYIRYKRFIYLSYVLVGSLIWLVVEVSLVSLEVSDAHPACSKGEFTGGSWYRLLAL